ncbi:hypothetical protein KZ829_13540 [Actinoplanes hulinensis]|uniref:Uncharacterized protein n=1 Tax=Actinoplanes hulinensis TaxID=1144547 RepID=A0ABS7B149_9ACTN|nr:hypothetical protein [Actinoplanes hulinensis]MBW6434761.1 hypothetical protein [Actinoplanes hulinensis]
MDNAFSLNQGRADGGPVNLKAYTSRSPRGDALARKPPGRCWIHDYEDGADGPRFVCRDANGEPVVAVRNIPHHRFRSAGNPDPDVRDEPGDMP